MWVADLIRLYFIYKIVNTLLILNLVENMGVDYNSMSAKYNTIRKITQGYTEITICKWMTNKLVEYILFFLSSNNKFQQKKMPVCIQKNVTICVHI